MAGELLLELLTEEIPARMQRRAIDDLTAQLRDKLKAADIPAASIEGHVTPRRLVVIADGIPARQPDRSEERRGPRVGAPEPAIAGFLRSAGLTSPDELETRGEFHFAVIKRPGRATQEVLPELILAAMTALPWPKSMRYPASSLRWVRPLNSVICLYDGEVVSLSLGDVPVGRITRGHRFLAPEAIEVSDAADYRAKLAKAHVVLDRAERRVTIDEELTALAHAAGVEVKPDEGLLEEVTGLVEYPVVLMGSIDADFVRPLPDGLPPEVLATAMRTHQKYFTCLNPDGTPAPRFLFVANNLTPDGGKTIAAGNERVLRARLSDARFFWDQDRKIRLEDRLDALRDRVFNDRLGNYRIQGLEKDLKLGKRPSQQNEDFGPWFSVRMKSWRMASLVTYLVDSGFVPGADTAAAAWAAELAKADLTTNMVGEFPELQGDMGRYYALADWGHEIADAIADQYKPLGPADSCPTKPTSVAVSLADKIDTLTVFFALDERPTGSRDPYALRRAALGIIRIVLENKLRLPLRTIFKEAYGRVDVNQAAGRSLGHIPSGVAAPKLADPSDELVNFIAERLKVHLREQGVRHDLASAVFALREDDLVRLSARVAALQAFLDSEDGANLLTAYRRASNIVTIEERKDDRHYDGDADPNRFQLMQEEALATSLTEVDRLSSAALKEENFGHAMAALATLRQPVDEFFERVTVNVPEKELRENRLRLLARIRATMNQIADFSQIEG